MKEMFDHITEFSKIENIREPIPRSYRLKDKDKKIDLPQIKKIQMLEGETCPSPIIKIIYNNKL